MNKPRINYWVDWASFALMMALVGTGLLLKFRLEGGGSVVLGLSRHEWGDVHFYIAVGLGVMVLVHLALHLGWVRALTLARATGDSRRLRAAGAIGAVAVMVGVVVVLLSMPVEWRAGEGGMHRRGGETAADGRGERRGWRAREVQEASPATTTETGQSAPGSR